MDSKKQSAPEYNPEVWEDDDRIRTSTNCYAYACDDPMGHHWVGGGPPQPGQASGFSLRVLEPETLIEAVVADGMIPAKAENDDTLPSQKDGHYLVAAVMGSGGHHHWYRQDKDGSWSHKPGQRAITRTDEDGKEITNPKKANHGTNYNCFVGYFHVPNGGLPIGKYGQRRREVREKVEAKRAEILLQKALEEKKKRR